MPEWRVELLDKSHERGRFSCGHASLDEFLKKYANQYAKRKLGSTYVAAETPGCRVLGYYTLAPSHFEFADAPQQLVKGLPRHPIPTLLLARLAVDHAMQGKGLGKFLLMDALERCVRVAEQVAFRAIEVEAIDVAAVAFYERYGFLAFPTNPFHLVLPLETAQGIFRP
jgi:GNAT superfamily N-acetyltransferase